MKSLKQFINESSSELNNIIKDIVAKANWKPKGKEWLNGGKVDDATVKRIIDLINTKTQNVDIEEGTNNNEDIQVISTSYRGDNEEIGDSFVSEINFRFAKNRYLCIINQITDDEEPSEIWELGFGNYLEYMGCDSDDSDDLYTEWCVMNGESSCEIYKKSGVDRSTFKPLADRVK
jgi:hypothetical protein